MNLFLEMDFAKTTRKIVTVIEAPPTHNIAWINAISWVGMHVSFMLGFSLTKWFLVCDPGANINGDLDRFGTPLCIACQQGSEKMVTFLLASGESYFFMQTIQRKNC